MRTSALLFLALIANISFFSIARAGGTVEETSSSGLVYPKVKRVNKQWSFRSAKANGNLTYEDPYVWLEELQANNTSVQDFISDQSTLTESFMKRCSNIEQIRQSLRQATNFDEYSRVGLYGESTKSPFYMYSLKRVGEQRKTWYTASLSEFATGKRDNFANPPGNPFLNESLLDSNGGANVRRIVISPNGKIFAYLVPQNNSDFSTWFFREMSSPLISANTTPYGGEGRLSVSIPLCQDDIIWKPDSSAFFYLQNQLEGDADSQMMIRFHQWGTSTDKDITMISKQPLFFAIDISSDGRWFNVIAYKDNSYKAVAYATLLDGQNISEKMKWISLAPQPDFQLYYLTTLNDSIYYQTDLGNATDGKAVKVDLDWSKARATSTLLDLTDLASFEDVIKVRKGALWYQQVSMAHDKLLVNYSEKGKDTLYLYDLRTGQMIQQILSNESASLYILKADPESNKAIVEFSGWNTPTKIYELEYDEGSQQVQSSIVTIQNVRGTKASDFTIEELYATSKDGTKVPYFVTKKGKRDNNRCYPTWLYVYGAYGYKQTLFYFSPYFTWINNYDSLFVWSVVRGGGEQGGGWHESATGPNKQRTYDDLLAITEDLERKGIACKGKIIVNGGSAGGMAALVGGNQAREGLIGVVLPERTVADYFLLALRSRIGEAQWSEFGNPNLPAEYDAIRAWSPLQNVQKKEYPAILLTPGGEDDRVSPAHSYKMLAQLQYANPYNKLPLLMYIAEKSGHVFSNSDTNSIIAESSRQFCFVEQTLGIKPRNN